MTAPGQTHGISVIIDPLMADLEISRTQISTAYLIGTLVGACAMPMVGRAIDTYGPRLVMAAVGAVFGGVLLALTTVSGIVGLTVGFVGIRMAGQGALSLVATTTVAYWFERRRGFALGIVGAVGTAGISLTPVLFERLVSATGWREAWAIQGLAVWAIVLPIALWGIRNRPADVGQHIDGTPPRDPATATDALTGWTLRAALRTGMFWVIVTCMATGSMLGTGLSFHQIDLLGERGLSATEAAANFLPQTAAVLVITLGAGALLDRLSPKVVLCGAMLTLAAGVLAAMYVTPGWSALAYGLILGSSGGMMRAVESAAVPRYFGTAHLGAIRGCAHTAVIGASALGPLAVSVGYDLSGGYTTALPFFAALPLLVAVAALLVRAPRPAAPEI
ncbi:MFS transporter [Streptomyces sp. ACA25]|uniref:MFS transporter n=1 Tax=Streptomyces sp. ACA25 TaxID=3022596 RepID=UPI002307A8F8|nr:MFS transporter [Streptomyces sp. ACA25]MDB1089856.1 MFS transporter [Streptomyces sp. ACA25]